MEVTQFKKRRIAWLSPLPPQKSGIANYSYWLVKKLRPFLDIDLYCDGRDLSDELKKNEVGVYPLTVFPQQHQWYDETIYHLGNNSLFHKEIYKLAWNFPATIVLHDYNLSAFMHEAFYLQADWRLYEEALDSTNGEPDRKKTLGIIPRLRRYVGTVPMSRAIVNRSRKVIVHHRWIKEQFSDAGHIHVIPMFAKVDAQPGREQIESFKKRFRIDPRNFILSCLGFINTNKMPQLQVEVAKRLLAQGYPVHLIFAGETAPEVKRLQSEVEASEYRENITFTGYLDDTDYLAVLRCSDVVINLRNPSMGEGSLTLTQALAAGKPAIISDINQYREFPDRVCWKVTHDENEAQLLYEYLIVLLSNRNVREALSRNSLDYAESVLALDRVVPQWLRLIGQ
ncbi:MAG TPA: glycosyltransferase family 4 protein [Pyrinomonadaceae bacterium]|jgi:glycosyltransferase involved in cell wall biosynthesis|nr:glycosyltransferase family 4 protein [Pyrinomonadaceae bacterium]